MATATKELIEVVADELELASVATRRLNGSLITAGIVGVGLGVAVGFYIGYSHSKNKLRSEAFAEAEETIAEMREHYRQKTVALTDQHKPDLDDVVDGLGYTATETSGNTLTTHPAATAGGVGHIDYGSQHRANAPAPLPVPIDPRKRVFRTESAAKDKMAEWDYDLESESRGEEDPYIIHQDEYLTNESGYSQSKYIYYSGDDVLVDMADPEVVLHNRETIIGDIALNKFGHGSDDYNIVHVRNPYLELEFEINRVNSSWETEVIGPEPDVDEE